VTPEEFRRFNGPVVPLAIMQKRVFKNDESFLAQIRIAQYSGQTIQAAKPVWTITTEDGKKLTGGDLAAGDIPVGNHTELGTVTFPLVAVARASRLVLSVFIPGTEWRNEWSFWVYPIEQTVSQGAAVICHNKDEMFAQLANGGTIVMLPDLKTLIGSTGTFQPIFWNKPWFPGQREHTLGLLIQNRHPAFKDFPTNFHADWQWWDLMMNSKPMVLDKLTPGLRPLVEPIDDWNTCHRLGTLIEAKVGKGKLLLAAIDLENNLTNRPVANQLRQSLIAYANSHEFQPKTELTAAELNSLFSGVSKQIEKVGADSQNPAYPAANAFDTDPGTIWHTEWEGQTPDYPHELSVEYAKLSMVSGVSLLPRQDGVTNGWVKDVEILTSVDGKTWNSVAKAQLRNDQEWKQVPFPATKAKCLRIRMLSPQKSQEKFASFAEIVPDLKD
jgi:hypothetical protein